jgi:hypothetical protein
MSNRFEELVSSRSHSEVAEIIKAAQSRHRYRFELWLMYGFVSASLVAVVWVAVLALNRFGLAGPTGLVSLAFGLAAIWLWLRVIVRLSFVIGQRAAVREAARGQRAAGA